MLSLAKTLLSHTAPRKLLVLNTYSGPRRHSAKMAGRLRLTPRYRLALVVRVFCGNGVRQRSARRFGGCGLLRIEVIAAVHINAGAEKTASRRTTDRHDVVAAADRRSAGSRVCSPLSNAAEAQLSRGNPADRAAVHPGPHLRISIGTMPGLSRRACRCEAELAGQS